MAPLPAPFLKRVAPVVRAGVTSCIVMQAGDILCQSIQRRNKSGALDWGAHDWKRTARFGLIGLTLHGPFFLWGFRMIDERFGPAKTLLTAAKKTAFGQVTIFPAYVAAFFTYIAILEPGGNLAAVGTKLRSSFLQTYVAGSVFWPAANMINFMCCPPSARILYVNGAGLVWNALLSAVNSQQAVAVGSPPAPAAVAVNPA
ncbi:hypothetical protein VOLCADRAFT_92190 [Volvox carteri f. nagariensis]|uniref:Uncharacterized protein n=1 Tax=Volvox carteri f. nagariensis TaxID=3068 RepID=D8TYU7_VOLCA|nr:uncharacterized protein VOLCADRAFT_92190 [Volvox carteri f. nagariensis]EFJ47454.1 hypothetical protein VOLCADRAFT_92190 [Volvox carteri f. nagariensis]|eukprot:XP_002951643.1 hypothetical protein VOLCADRAFT_92190 [Volvox carteri f. nagariensis]